jgi:hypothetical protein
MSRRPLSVWRNVDGSETALGEPTAELRSRNAS